MEYIRVVKFERYQRYSGRRMPWIKLYTKMLEDPDIWGLPDSAFRLVIVLLLLAAETENRIPNNPLWIKKRGGIGAKKGPISALLAQISAIGFIEFIDDSDVSSGTEAGPNIKKKRESTTEVPNGTSSVLSPQQAEVKRIEDAFRAIDITPPAPPIIASWWKRSRDTEVPLGPVVDEALAQYPTKGWQYVHKVVLSWLKEGGIPTSRAAQPAGQQSLRSALDQEDDEAWTNDGVTDE